MSISEQEWAGHQHFEADWWGDCTNTYGEESKQIAYARVMDMDPGVWQGGDRWPRYKVRGNVIDVGGGPSSMLLKTEGFAYGIVVDPCPYPAWTRERYAAHGVSVWQAPAEEALYTYSPYQFDEAWCYNVLQHTIDPEAIVRQMAQIARRVRIFEWIDTPPHPGHPHTLRSDEMRKWVGGKGLGRVVWLDEQYQEIGPLSDSPVRQAAWGGSFRT